MDVKTIIGRVGKKKISENYYPDQPNIKEQELTARRNIIKKFLAQGYNEADVIFE